MFYFFRLKFKILGLFLFLLYGFPSNLTNFPLQNQPTETNVPTPKIEINNSNHPLLFFGGELVSRAFRSKFPSAMPVG